MSANHVQEMSAKEYQFVMPIPLEKRHKKFSKYTKSFTISFLFPTIYVRVALI